MEKNYKIGLSTEEIKQRVLEGKVNGDQNVKTKSVGQIIRTNTFTFFNFLLVALAVILLAIQEFKNVLFLGVVLVNWLIGIFQELRAKKTIDKLSLISAPRVNALRDGVETEIMVKDIVLDDVILLNAGNQICSDSVVLDGSIEVNESLITGEADAIRKTEGDELLSGSFVISGKASTRVIHVGNDNYATKISKDAKYIKKSGSEILKSLTRLIKLMAIVIIPLGLALFAKKFWADELPLVDTIKTTIGTLVGMIPSGLVALTSAVFCVSVIRLAKHNTLAQDLYSVETLARVDTLCLDKTGTITEGIMQVMESAPVGENTEDFRLWLKNLNSAIGDSNPTATAIADYTEDVVPSEKAESIVPFSSARKWSGANFESYSLIMGAMEFIFKNPTEEMIEKTSAFSEKGYRVLVLAKTTETISEEGLPDEVELLGYIILSDKIRKEAPDTLRYFAEQGVTVKIISGDNPITVKNVAERAGVINCDKYVDASTLKTPEEIERAVDEYTVFGRVTPQQKLAFVKALKKGGHTVAMTGDGVNDVLALKEADCSVAMAAGSDAAKSVSSLVLLDSNFASMPKVVAEGRRSVNNLERSASLYLVKTIFSVLFAIIFLFVKSELPFEPIHLTLIGGVTIGIPSFILALEPNNELIKGRFIVNAVSRALPGALVIVFNIAIILIAEMFIPLAGNERSTVALIATTFVGFIILFFICIPFNKIRIAMLAVLILGFVGVFLLDLFVFSGLFFESTPLNTNMGMTLLPVAIIDIPLFIFLRILLEQLEKKHFLDKLLRKL